MSIKGPITSYAYVAASTLVGKKFYSVTLDGTGQIALSGAGDVALGIVVDEPAATKTGSVCQSGPCWAKAGSEINAGDTLKSDAAGKLIPTTLADDYYLGRALEDAATDDEVSIFVEPGYRSV